MKALSRGLLMGYVLLLLWLVLFKLSWDISGVLGYGMRNLNLIPFADYSASNRGEMIANFVVFVPLGLLLRVNFKQLSFGRMLTAVLGLSMAVELVQFALAIGTTDITDIIMNTLGGAAGLAAYAGGNRYIAARHLDRFIVIMGIGLFVAILWLRIFVFQVRY